MTEEKQEDTSTFCAQEQKVKKPFWMRWWFWVIVIFFLLILISSNGKNDLTDQAVSDNLQIEEEMSEEELLQISAQNYEKGIEMFEIEKYDDAEKYLLQTIFNDPNYNNAQDKIKEINTMRAEEYLSKAKIKLENNNFEGARKDLNKAISYNPILNEAKDLLSEVDLKEQEYLEKKKEQEIADFKAACQTYEYKILKKDAEKFIGERIKIRGNIMQIQESNTFTFMLLQVTNLSHGIWTDNVAIMYYGIVPAYEDDIITVFGEINGFYSYQSVSGWNITVPSLVGKYIEI